LKPEFSDAVVQRIKATADSIGARTAAARQKCDVNIEVIFSSNAQAVLDDIDHHHPTLLGSARRSGDTRITRAIQSWYTTGTRQEIPPVPHPLAVTRPPRDASADQKAVQNEHLDHDFAPGLPGTAGVVPDPPYAGAAPIGLAGSYLTAALRSELLQVLVIVDVQKAQGLSMEQLSDYIAMVSLSRITQLDTCNELPSILDLLSVSCSGRPHPTALTSADAAFLKALYATELEKIVNVEQGEVRDRMLATLKSTP